MTDNNDRLDGPSNDLETVKEILIAVARRAEATDSRLDRLAQGYFILNKSLSVLRLNPARRWA